MALDLSAAVAAANALPYATSPFAQGIQAADYAAQYELHGELFRFWESAVSDASPNKSGLVHGEVDADGKKGRFYQTRQDVMTEEFGLVPRGSTMFSVLPSVVEATPGARVLRIAQTWRGKAEITRGDGAIDPLPERFVTALEAVTLPNGSAASLSNVAAVSADSPDDGEVWGIEWLGSAPAEGARYSVRFRYQPFYECLGELIQGSPVGTDGERLPRHVLLKKVAE